MDLQEVRETDAQINKELNQENSKNLSVTYASYSGGDCQNGMVNNPLEHKVLKEEKLEMDLLPKDIMTNDNLLMGCDKMSDCDLSVLNSPSLNGASEINCQELVDVVTDDSDQTAERKSSKSFSFQRVNSDNSSSESSYSDDPSFGNTTDEPLDSVHDEIKEEIHDCLSHPTHKLCVQELQEIKNESLKLGETVKRLKELLLTETQKNSKLSELEQRLIHYERELELSKKEQEIDRRTYEAIKKESDCKYASLKKDYDTANKDRENMVMRYAISEKELIDTKKEKEVLLKKLKESMKENEALLDKVKTIGSEKAKLTQIVDSKTIDLSNSHKEIDKLKEEINSRDIKIKWTQNKLKTEMETHKECPQQIDKLMLKVRNLEEELNIAKLDTEKMKKDLHESEQNKALESQLKEEQAKLIMERHEHSEVDSKYKTLQVKHQSIIEENNSLSLKVQHLETERLEMEKKLSFSREETEKLSNLASELQSKLVEMDSLTVQLKQSEDKVNSLLIEMDRVRHKNEELLQDMSACRAKETEMLSFTQKLTTKNVQLQSEFSAVEAKATDLAKKEEKYRNEVKDLKEQVNELQSLLEKEKAKRGEETRLLARQVAEKKRKGQATEQELQDTKAALTQAKTKHATIAKELQRELSYLRKKLEKLEAHGSFNQSDSLNSLSEPSIIQACDLPPQNLVERILKLQGDNAKLAEKIEFLEEHSAHLLSEVQRKSRLLQSYILREEAGALTPSFLDNHKAEVTKHGGIMASLYGGASQDDGMSLELCLEINRKLQAVLEDTLLKNIMLKENLDTLGDEISRLTGKK